MQAMASKNSTVAQDRFLDHHRACMGEGLAWGLFEATGDGLGEDDAEGNGDGDAASKGVKKKAKRPKIDIGSRGQGGMQSKIFL